MDLTVGTSRSVVDRVALLPGVLELHSSLLHLFFSLIHLFRLFYFLELLALTMDLTVGTSRSVVDRVALLPGVLELHSSLLHLFFY